MANGNATSTYPLEIIKGAADDLAITIEGRDLSGSDVRLRVKLFDGDASYTLEKTAVISYLAPDSVLTFSITAVESDISWSRGVFTIFSVTNNEALLTGEFFVKSWGA